MLSHTFAKIPSQEGVVLGSTTMIPLQVHKAIPTYLTCCRYIDYGFIAIPIVWGAGGKISPITSKSVCEIECKIPVPVLLCDYGCQLFLHVLNSSVCVH
jgi:hypothetical protein